MAYGIRRESSATYPYPFFVIQIALTPQSIAHAVAGASSLSREVMAAWNQVPLWVFIAMWGDTGEDILAVTGRTRRLGLKTSEEIGGLFASFVGRRQ
jgi:hypothetical protein